MKEIIDKYGLKSVNELRKYFTFGENCMLCIPYIELVFKTGKTEFQVINMDLKN